MLVIPIGGAVLVALGSLALAAALWRAGTVPRWVIVLGVASTVATFVLPPSGAAGLVAEGLSSLTTVALGWYALQLGRFSPQPQMR